MTNDFDQPASSIEMTPDDEWETRILREVRDARVPVTEEALQFLVVSRQELDVIEAFRHLVQTGTCVVTRQPDREGTSVDDFLFSRVPDRVEEAA